MHYPDQHRADPSTSKTQEKPWMSPGFRSLPSRNGRRATTFLTTVFFAFHEFFARSMPFLYDFFAQSVHRHLMPTKRSFVVGLWTFMDPFHPCSCWSG
jgi:hypothetical protein